MGDFIDRQDVYEILTEYYHHHTDIQHDALREALSRVPSANPEQKWIPVTKALPRNETNVLVTVRDDSGDTPWEYTSTGWRTPDGKYWIVDYEICYGVIAWMPLPEPLRGER